VETLFFAGAHSLTTRSNLVARVVLIVLFALPLLKVTR